MSDELKAALIAAWDEQEAGPGIWVHIVTGVGEEAFCAGADLKKARPNGPALAPWSACRVGFLRRGCR